MPYKYNQMTNYKLLFMIIIGVLYSCSGITNKTASAENQTIDVRIDTSNASANNKNMSEQTEITNEDIIRAAEKQIEFYKTASKEKLVEFLGISKERVASISNKQFDKLVRDGNTHMYKFLIDGLKKDNIAHKVVSVENNIYEVSFKEKGNESAVMMMNFEKTEKGLIVSQKRN